MCLMLFFPLSLLTCLSLFSLVAGFKGGLIKYKWGQRCTEKSLNKRSNRAKKKIDVVFLQEKHGNSTNEKDWSLLWGGENVLSHGTDISAEVANLF